MGTNKEGAVRWGKLKLGSYEVDMLDKIGQGSYGVVYKGKHISNHDTVAAKQCDVKCEKAGGDAMIEIKHFQSVQNHPHIVTLFDFHYKNKAVWMIMEYCDAGDLDQYFKKKVPDMKEQVNIMYQSASAVSYMHCQVNTVIHRDIKPGNILMKIQGGHAIVKVTDFGLSKIVESAETVTSLMFSTKAGTPGFMAPEFFLNVRHEKSVDVFALGLVFLAMTVFKPGDENLAPIVGSIMLPIGAQLAQLGQFNMPMPDFVKDNDDDCQAVRSMNKLVRRMLKYAPKERCLMRQVVAALEDMGGTSPSLVPTTIPKHRTNQLTKPPTECDSTTALSSHPLHQEQEAKHEATKSQKETSGDKKSSESESVGDTELERGIDNSAKDVERPGAEDENSNEEEEEEEEEEEAITALSGEDVTADEEVQNSCAIKAPSAQEGSGATASSSEPAGGEDIDKLKEDSAEDGEDIAPDKTFLSENDDTDESSTDEGEAEDWNKEHVTEKEAADKDPEKDPLSSSEETPHKEFMGKADDPRMELKKEFVPTNEDTDKNYATGLAKPKGTGKVTLGLGSSITDNNSGASGIVISRNIASTIGGLSGVSGTTGIACDDLLKLMGGGIDLSRNISSRIGGLSGYSGITGIPRDDLMRVARSYMSGDSGDNEIRRLAMKLAIDETLKEHMGGNDDTTSHYNMSDDAVNQFEAGEQVVVLDDLQKVKDLQENYGGFNSDMAQYLGKYGVVKETIRGRMLRVLHDDGRAFAYNPRAVYKTGEKPYNPDQLDALDGKGGLVNAIRSQFKRFDVVMLSEEKEVVELLQDGHGEWRSDMKYSLGVKGMVNRVDDDGDIVVEFIHGEMWILNPEVLIPCDMSGVAVEAGDFVIIADDKPLAEHLQRELGHWDDGLEQRLGHSGVVQEVTDNYVSVELGRRTIQWHPRLIKLVAKGDELMRAVMRKNRRQ